MEVIHWPNRLGVNVEPETEIMLCIGALRVTTGTDAERRCLVIKDPAITHSTRSPEIPDRRYLDAIARCRREGEVVD